MNWQTLLVSWLTLLSLSIGLAMDALAVSIAVGLSLGRVTRRQTFRLAFHFGLFQFLMPVLGWLAGSRLAGYVRTFDHWIAFGLLAYVGGKMLLEARRPKDALSTADPTRGLMLVTLSVATSIDALAVGLTMALVGVSVWVPSVVIGLVAATLTMVGLRFGSRLGPRWGTRAQVVGGCVLLLIGLKILIGDLVEPARLPARHASGATWHSSESGKPPVDAKRGRGAGGRRDAHSKEAVIAPDRWVAPAEFAAAKENRRVEPGGFVAEDGGRRRVRVG